MNVNLDLQEIGTLIAMVADYIQDLDEYEDEDSFKKFEGILKKLVNAKNNINLDLEEIETLIAMVADYIHDLDESEDEEDKDSFKKFKVIKKKLVNTKRSNHGETRITG